MASKPPGQPLLAWFVAFAEHATKCNSCGPTVVHAVGNGAPLVPLALCGVARAEMETRAVIVADPDVEAPRCSGCHRFLSAIRIEMKLDRCAECDGRGRGRRRL